MAKSRVEADTITYNAAISVCEKAGEWVRALQLLQSMENSRVEANTITYSAAISATRCCTYSESLMVHSLFWRAQHSTARAQLTARGC